MTAQHVQHAEPPPKEENLKGDPEDLTPLHPSHFIFTPPRPAVPPPPPPPKVWENYSYTPTKGETGDLAVAATRHGGGHKRPHHQSYNRHYNPKPKHYSSHNRNQGGKKTKGGYQDSNSYQGKKGYSSYSSFDRANKGDYGDADHREYNHKDGGQSSGGYGGGRSYGSHGGEYGDDGNSYHRPEY